MPEDEPQRLEGEGKASKKRKKKKQLGPDAAETAKRLKRGPAVDLKGISDKKLKGKLRRAENVITASQKKAAAINEWLLPASAGTLEAEEGERTWNFKQEAIVAAVDVTAAQKAFDLSLPHLGPYNLSFTRNGRFMLLGGTMGHLALMDWQRSHLVCEVQVRETVRDVVFLHNETFWAAAQKKYVYVYDKRGIEVHCLRDHTEVHALDFLPHHFLLTSVGEHGVLRYQDTSTGHIVAQHKTKLGPCGVMRQNPHNAVMMLGHARGCVTMWTPNLTVPAVKMLCHQGPVTALCADPSGTYLATAGADKQLKVWDIRMLRPMHAYFTYAPITQLDISQRGLLAAGHGRRVQVWQDALRTKAQSPYMNHHVPEGVLQKFRFCPYEDVLGIGHSGGISTMLVPGAGEPNFDSFVANPFQTVRQRQQGEVVALLDKLQPDTIVLDPDTVGRVRKEPAEVVAQRRQEEAAANAARLAALRRESETKAKMKGKNRPSRKHRKKQSNIIEDRKPTVKERQKQEAERKKEAAAKKAENAIPEDAPRAPKPAAGILAVSGSIIPVEAYARFQQLSGDLSNNSIGGTLPVDWSSLLDLEVLALSDNLIGGSLPVMWAALKGLRELRLRNNRLQGGGLPAAWGGGMAYLQVADLSDNPQLGQGMAGTLPVEWAALRRLIQLDLSGNQLSGPLPVDWTGNGASAGGAGGGGTNGGGGASLSQLRLLDVSGNMLQGTLPADWSRFVSLQQANLHYNALSGTVPESWGALHGLASLRLMGNAALCGPVPTVLMTGAAAPMTAAVMPPAALTAAGGGTGVDAAGPAAQAMAINGTRLLRECSWSRAAGLLLSFRGTLSDPRGALASWTAGTDPCAAFAPSRWAGVACDPLSGAVVGLELSGFGLAGTLSAGLALLGGGLTGLDLGGNNLRGTLPDGWSSLTGLAHLSLAHNTLSGGLQPSWSSLRALSYMDMSYNGLRGPLPDAWGEGLHSLMEIHLDGNGGLNGSLPVSWAGTGDSAMTSNADSGAAGPVSTRGGGLTSLLSLTADSNSLSGDLPPSWSRLASLQELSLKGNRLAGAVPDAWGRGMTSLRYLGLSSNAGMCGRVPFALAGSGANSSNGGASTPAPATGVRLEYESTQLGASCPEPAGGVSAASVQLWAAAAASSVGTLVLVALITAAVTSFNRHRQRTAGSMAKSDGGSPPPALPRGAGSMVGRGPSSLQAASPRAPLDSPRNGAALDGSAGHSFSPAARLSSAPGPIGFPAGRQLSCLSPYARTRDTGALADLGAGVSWSAAAPRVSVTEGGDGASGSHGVGAHDMDVLDSAAGTMGASTAMSGLTRLVSALLPRVSNPGGGGGGTAHNTPAASPRRRQKLLLSEEDTAAAADIYQALLLASDAMSPEALAARATVVAAAEAAAAEAAALTGPGEAANACSCWSPAQLRSPRLSNNPLYGMTEPLLDEPADATVPPGRGASPPIAVADSAAKPRGLKLRASADLMGEAIDYRLSSDGTGGGVGTLLQSPVSVTDEAEFSGLAGHGAGVIHMLDQGCRGDGTEDGVEAAPRPTPPLMTAPTFTLHSSSAAGGAGSGSNGTLLGLPEARWARLEGEGRVTRSAATTPRKGTPPEGGSEGPASRDGSGSVTFFSPQRGP
ncbi:hypothetical protein GPECTOR_2g1391 [Gonium pectorale]|uniref:Leucine-rich repeat and WD repeat-containing protein 1 n=1 Tax=Gonium pectorale TaxID=33097 RepID=A0A150H2M6_GONPE|nr:hypothetical protein GPECTOR_2g1391 [Gonium pectorale]|eukprot:KXZ55840.1 hypothetical protein GPECTOR_2g1391 [Gonium pectorale]